MFRVGIGAAAFGRAKEIPMQPHINPEGQDQHTATVEAMLDDFAAELLAGAVEPVRADATISTIAEHMLDDRTVRTLDEAQREIDAGLRRRGVRPR